LLKERQQDLLELVRLDLGVQVGDLHLHRRHREGGVRPGGHLALHAHRPDPVQRVRRRQQRPGGRHRGRGCNSGERRGEVQLAPHRGARTGPGLQGWGPQGRQDGPSRHLDVLT
ncbi:unnamed protein product, partial [Ixodes pacificus]